MMRYRLVRAFLALMIVIPAIAGLHRPAAASVPLTLDVSDGYTFSGVQRSTKSGAINEFTETLIGPFTVSGERGFVQLSWDTARSQSFLNCDPAQSLESRSDTIQNHQTNHYSVDLSGTSGAIESIYLGIPSFENAGIGTTTPFPLEAVTKSITFFTPDGEVTIPMVQITPTSGDTLAYEVAFDPPQPAGQLFNFDLTFEGEVEPPMSGNPQTNSLNCPAPNDDLEETTDFGRTQLFLNDPHLVVNVADTTPNEPPVFDLQGTTTVIEGDTVNAVLTISDLDGDPITYGFELGGAPCNIVFDDAIPSSIVITFTCPTKAGDAGTYVYSVTASDGKQTVSMDVVITVTEPEPAPSLDEVDDVIIDENVSLSFDVTGSNLDPNDTYTLTSNLPAFGSASPFMNGMTTLTLSPTFDDAGTYPGTVTLTSNSDPNVSDTKSFMITVNDVNRSPNLDPIGDVVIDEGGSTTISIIGGDADGDSTVITADVPAFASPFDNGDGTGSITVSPTFDDAGTYTGSVSITDTGNPNLTVTDTFTITVINVNRNPNLLPIDDVNLNEDESRTITIKASDPDGDNLTIVPPSLPDFAILTPNGDGTATITFSPGQGDAASYLLTVSVVDDGDPVLGDTESFTLTVNEVEGPGVETYDELETLVRAYVENRFIEGLLTGTLNLAQYFDEEVGLDAAAVAMLRTFIRLVQASTPRWIDPEASDQMIRFAEQLIDNIIGP